MSLKSHWISETKILFWQKMNIYLWGLSSIFSLFFSWSLWNSSKWNVIHQIKKMWPYAENDITWPRIFVIPLSLFCSLSTSPVLFFTPFEKIWQNALLAQRFVVRLLIKFTFIKYSSFLIQLKMAKCYHIFMNNNHWCTQWTTKVRVCFVIFI